MFPHSYPVYYNFYIQNNWVTTLSKKISIKWKKVFNLISFTVFTACTISNSSGIRIESFALFCLYKRYSLKLKCNYLLVANDLKVYVVITSSEDIQFLQNDLIVVPKWCHNNLMMLNCVIASLAKRSKCIKVVASVKDLGILLDNKLTFVPHIQFVIWKANKTLGCIRRYSRDFHHVRTTNILFVSLVWSILEYGSIVT